MLITNQTRVINQLIHMLKLPINLRFSSDKPNAPVKNNKNFRADSILKNYFNTRLQMSNATMVGLIDQLKNVKVNSAFFNDHRWIHLNVAIQKNINTFSIQDQLKILQGLTKLNNFNDLFHVIVQKLGNNAQILTPNQIAILMYFMAKGKKVKPDTIRNLSDSLILSLHKKQTKLKFKNQLKSNKKQSNQEKQDQEKQIDDEQSLFDNEFDFNTDSVKQQSSVDCRNLVLCLWSLQKMKIRDDILEQCLLKIFIRPSIPKMPASLFPLLLSTLWLKNMQNKRIFQQITSQILFRQNQLLQLDRDKMKMMICMLCKPTIHKLEQKQENNKDSQQTQAKNRNKEQKKQIMQEKRKKIVLWLMQTLHIKIINNQQYIFATTAYQILLNASQANIFDADLYIKYLTIICKDLSKIQTKQIVYLLSILQKIKKAEKLLTNNRLKANETHRQQQNILFLTWKDQYDVLTNHLIKNVIKFINKTQPQNIARVQLRRMTLTGFLNLPNNLKRNILHQQKIVNQNSPGNKKLEWKYKHPENQTDLKNKFKPNKFKSKEQQLERSQLKRQQELQNKNQKTNHNTNQKIKQILQQKNPIV